MGFFATLFIVLMVLKVLGIIAVGWGTLFFILMIPALIFFVVMIIVGLFSK